MYQYNFLLEGDLDPTTKWTYGGQYDKIKEILDRYPTPTDFKNAVLSTKNKQAIYLTQKLDDNADRNQYIDFLQNIYVKYSGMGKFLASLGIGAVAGYFVNKAVSNHLNKKNQEYSDSKMNDIESKMNDIEKNKFKINRKIGNLWKERNAKIKGEKEYTRGWAGTDEDYSGNLANLKREYIRKISALRNKRNADIASGNANIASSIADIKNNLPYKNADINSYLSGLGAGSATGLGVAGLGKLFDRKRVDDLKN